MLFLHGLESVFQIYLVTKGQESNWGLNATRVQSCIYTCIFDCMSLRWIWFRCLHSPSTVKLHIVLLSISNCIR